MSASMCQISSKSLKPRPKLDFQIFELVTVEVVKKVEVHQCAKFRRNGLNCGRDMVICRMLKMAAAAIWDIRNLKSLTF